MIVFQFEMQFVSQVFLNAIHRPMQFLFVRTGYDEIIHQPQIVIDPVERYDKMVEL